MRVWDAMLSLMFPLMLWASDAQGTPFPMSQQTSNEPEQQGNGNRAATFPFYLEFERMSAVEINEVLSGVHVPAEIDTQNPNVPGAERTPLIPEYSIARYDLDGDGTDEFFLYTGGAGLCGSAGCQLDVYRKSNAGISENILGKDGHGIISPLKVAISQNETGGYHDLLLYTTHGYPGTSTWRYEGRHYVRENQPRQTK